MSMKQNGLCKLTEEFGEVIQIAGKMQQYPELQLTTDDRALHPDGTNLRHCMENELGDAFAAIMFVTAKLGINEAAIDRRMKRKLALFLEWDKEV